MAAIPRIAATVILLRERTRGFEVLLLKRHEKSSFMAGNFVYPGGRIDREDGLPEVCALCRGLPAEEARLILGESISGEESLAFWVGGIRELFEEAGVLLAYDRPGGSLVMPRLDRQGRFSHYRRSLQKREITLLQMAREERLLFAADQLRYYARWITPEARPERFDTRFFLALCPSGQEASHDEEETTDSLWLKPRTALEENLRGEIALSPPTLKTLEDLSRFENIGEMFNPLRQNETRPVLPVLTKSPEGPVILFPWDPEYPLFREGRSPAAFDHGTPSGPADNTTRLLMRGGRWLPYFRHK